MIVKQGEIRANIKKYFDLAYEGEYIVVPRKENKNIVILSERRFEQLQKNARLEQYAVSLTTLRNKSPKIASYLDTTDIKTENENRLQAFREFQDGWNGYDAKAFSPSLLDKVSEIVSKQDIQPEIFPTAVGTIQLEYDNSRGDHMEIEISEESKAEVFTVLKNGAILSEEISSSAESIKERAGAFYG